VKKRAFSVLLALSLTLALAVPALAARVVLSPQKVYVDGAEAAFEGYNIDGYNYFRLQDLAIALKDCPARFSVAYDAAADLVALVRGGDCALTDGGAPAGGDRSASAAPSVQTVTIDGAPARLSPYNIGGYNFFRLGELAPLLGFGLAYDRTENSVKITGAPVAVTVSFIDVGQGDSVFIDDGDFEVLIDAGTADKGNAVSDSIRPYVDGDLDVVIATHTHADHVGGLTRVLADYQVDEIIDSGDTADSRAWTDYHAAAMAEPNCAVVPDSDFTVSMANGATLRIIEGLDGDANPNNDSVAALLTFGQVRVLFTGDSEEAAEAVLAGKVGDVDVFKAAHHGSRTANTMALLNVIRPEYAVVSCGAGNPYGHPHLAALQNFAAVGTTVYSTEKSGTVVMTTDGLTYSFNTSAALTLADAGDQG